MTSVSQQNCIFCAIANKKINANIVFENDSVMAFHDINKVADIHVLIIPKTHIGSIEDITPENAHVMAEVTLAVSALTKQLGIAKSGYRLVINTGEDGGQTVFHLHVHLMGARKFSWPPG